VLGGVDMRLANRTHTLRPWRIHALIPDFHLEDVWALPTPGGSGDFPRLVEALAAGEPSRGASPPARVLWAIRSKLGELFGWDRPEEGIGSRVPSLRERLPPDLRDAPRGPEFPQLPFAPLYLLDDEFAAEAANRTVHGVLHLGWVPDGGDGAYRGEMAVYVKPNGLLGNAYMAAIRPFRHRIVYPPLMRRIERERRRPRSP
jgi:Protein of unknown function (DUF2867)